MIDTDTKWTYLPADGHYTEGDYVCAWGTEAGVAREAAKREVDRTGRPQVLYKLIAVEVHQ